MKLSFPLRSVCLCSLFSHENKALLYLVCLGLIKAVDEGLSLLMKLCARCTFKPFLVILQYIGSLEVGRPGSRMEIVAAMRRIRVRHLDMRLP